MTEYQSVLTAAQQLPEADKLRLIDELWNSVPPDSETAFSAEWSRKIDRRISELESGKPTTVPWSQVRNAALARDRRGKPR
jgi:putative addiction module component (TIGR02574 family)